MNDDLAVIVFTAADRCDRCGAQAYFLAQRDDVAADLLFCGHHGSEHTETLLIEGWTVISDHAGLEQLADNEGIPV
jgi:hypothetical protein